MKGKREKGTNKNTICPRKTWAQKMPETVLRATASCKLFLDLKIGLTQTRKRMQQVSKLATARESRVKS